MAQELKRGQFKDETGNPAFWLSWSRLLTHEKCQQKGKFDREGKGDTVKQGRNFVSGTVADRAMRKWLEQKEPQKKGQMAEYVHELWDQYTINSDEYQITWRENDPVADQKAAKDLALTAVNNIEDFLIARVLPYEYQPEWRFKTPLRLPDSAGMARTVVLNGGADIVLRDPATNNWVVYDLKVTKNNNYISGPILAQLIFYQIVVHMEFDVPYENITAAFLTPACKIQYRGLEISKQDRQHLMTRIMKFAQFVWDDTPPVCVADDNACFGCTAKRICPKWADVTIKAPDGSNRISLADTGRQRRIAKENAE